MMAWDAKTVFVAHILLHFSKTVQTVNRESMGIPQACLHANYVRRVHLLIFTAMNLNQTVTIATRVSSLQKVLQYAVRVQQAHGQSEDRQFVLCVYKDFKYLQHRVSVMHATPVNSKSAPTTIHVRYVNQGRFKNL